MSVIEYITEHTFQTLGIYLLLINMFLFILMWADKRNAIKNKHRFREDTLFLFAIFGGEIGGMAAMYIFRHKTQKKKFTRGFPIILAVHIALIALAYFTGSY